jgi:hypothetical protein
MWTLGADMGFLGLLVQMVGDDGQRRQAGTAAGRRHHVATPEANSSSTALLR